VRRSIDTHYFEEDAKRLTCEYVVLALLGVATLVIRYNGQGGRLVQVIRRDGGRHYISLLGWARQLLLSPSN
jgi:hypothetical protein